MKNTPFAALKTVGAITVVTALLVIGLLKSGAVTLPAQTDLTTKETAYKRVMRTGVLRCGYSVWDPLFYIDPKTNEKRGIFHDEMEEAAQRLGLKLVWQEELGWGSVVEAVKSGRVDAACSGYWLNPGRIKNLLPTAAQLYSPLYVWMRQGDTLIPANPDDLNSSRYTVGTIDGSVESQIISRRFAKARLVSLPEMDTSSDLIENLTSGKVDFIIVDTGTLAAYIANNPGKIANAFPGQPMNLFPNVALLAPDEMRFKQVLDDTLRNIEYDGTLDAILKKYDMDKGFLRNPKPAAG